MTKGTVFVASPSAIGRMPDASGSSVPAWPAFLALSARFATATACVDVMPTPLSRISQPFTARRFGRSCGGRGPRGPARSTRSVDGASSDIIMRTPAPLGAFKFKAKPHSELAQSAGGRDCSSVLGAIARPSALDISAHLLAAQERVDAGRLVEGFVA